MDPSVRHQISERNTGGQSPCRYMHHSFQNCEPWASPPGIVPDRSEHATRGWRRAKAPHLVRIRRNQMPRIVQFYRLGGPEVLEIEDVPSSEPSAGEVTLRVEAIGLNRAESMFMHGYYLEPPRLPARL